MSPAVDKEGLRDIRGFEGLSESNSWYPLHWISSNYPQSHHIPRNQITDIYNLKLNFIQLKINLK